ncbi:type III-A CRISPR-associated RAMP protein Csm5 [candidate division Kazan bacterium]|uniref:CRISPR system Cms protein Csm5 n=1 Tax=candidate division Kazan bacterium TaxID=2202143 RepID=A0A420ZCY1_UNCK3|nr:MAG: type III-A CRISPR-associated RAMP protein Csm5 [candidate division Kazan bacterium]
MKMKIKLKTITPIHIGTGQKYGRIECLVRKDRVFRISLEKVMKIYGQSIIEKIIERIETDEFNVMNNVDENKVLKYSLLNKANYTKGDIREHIKTDTYMPYIPGSSIKGSVRTALLWNFFKNNTQSFDSFLSSLNNKINKPGRCNKKYLMADLIQNVFNFVKGKYNAQKDLLKFFLISDFMPLNVEIFLDKINTHDLKNNKPLIRASMFAECITGEFIGEIALSEQIKFFNNDEFFKIKFNEIFGVEIDCKKEIKEIETEVVNNIKTILRNFNKWAEYHETKLEEKMKLNINIPPQDINKIRLGFGVGTIYQTLIKLIEEYDVTLAKNVVNKCFLGKFSRKIDFNTKNSLYPPYPKTVELNEDNKPLGWCEISEVEK